MKFKNFAASGLMAVLCAPFVDTLTLARRRFLDRFKPEHANILKAPMRPKAHRRLGQLFGRHPVLLGLPDKVLPMYRGGFTRESRVNLLVQERKQYAEDLKGTFNASGALRCRNERRLAARKAVRYAGQFA